MESRASYYTVDSYGKNIRKLVFFSIAISLCIFLLVPFSELLMNKKNKLMLRRVDRAVVKKVPPIKPPEIKKEKKKMSSKPKLTKTRSKLNPLKINASLALSSGIETGDFAIDIGFGPELGRDSFVFELSEVDKPPVPTIQMPPMYPLHAKMQGVEGKVELNFTVTEEGNVADIVIESSVPRGVFDNAAVNAVRKWRFKPAVKGGKAVSVRVKLPLKFELEN